MLTAGFGELPQTAKIVHAMALEFVALNVILLITLAALHRLSSTGRTPKSFSAPYRVS